MRRNLPPKTEILRLRKVFAVENLAAARAILEDPNTQGLQRTWAEMTVRRWEEDGPGNKTVSR